MSDWLQSPKKRNPTLLELRHIIDPFDLRWMRKLPPFCLPFNVEGVRRTNRRHPRHSQSQTSPFVFGVVNKIVSLKLDLLTNLDMTYRLFRFFLHSPCNSIVSFIDVFHRSWGSRPYFPSLPNNLGYSTLLPDGHYPHLDPGSEASPPTTDRPYRLLRVTPTPTKIFTLLFCFVFADL